MDHPGQFSYFIHAGACIHDDHRPVEIVGFRAAASGMAMHHMQTARLYMSNRVSPPAPKIPLIVTSLIARADHVESNHAKHPFEITGGLGRQLYKMQNDRRCQTHEKRYRNSAHTGNFHQADAIFFPLLQIACSELISHHNTGVAPEIPPLRQQTTSLTTAATELAAAASAPKWPIKEE